MNSRNIKVVDEHNIDRSANILFAFELEGSGYVSYSIERDEENNNIFLSKVIRNLDGTFNMLDIDDSEEKSKLNNIVKVIITTSVESQEDKMAGDSLTLSDGKEVKFLTVSFNKEQKINVQKTYITTVKKEVTKVVEKYYAKEIVLEQSKEVENIFPTLTPVVEPANDVLPEIPTPVVETKPVEVEMPVLSVPVMEEPKIEPILPVQNVEPVKEEAPVVEVPVAPAVVDPISVSTPEPERVVDPQLVVPTPVSSVPESQPLVFNASKETNLNAALGEVANSASIPVENIEPVIEFGVDTPVQQPAVAPATQTETMADSGATGGATAASTLTKKGGFANSKFFMVVAIAFFLASCVFLGYEVFNYFQLTK